MFLDPLRRWLRNTWLARVPLVLRSAFLRDLLWPERSTKKHPERFTKARLNLEALEKILAPQPLVAASMPFILIGLTATGLPAEDRSRRSTATTDLDEQGQDAGLWRHDDSSIAAAFTGWLPNNDTLLASAAAAAATEDRLADDDHSVLTAAKREEGKLFLDSKEDPTSGRGGHTAAPEGGNHAQAGASGGGGGSDSHTPQLQLPSGTGNPGQGNPPTPLPDLPSLTSFLDAHAAAPSPAARANAAAQHASATPSSAEPSAAAGAAGNRISQASVTNSTLAGTPLTAVQTGYAQPQLGLTPNQGQTDSTVEFTLAHGGVTAFIQAGGAVRFEVPVAPADNGNPTNGPSWDVFDMHLVGGNTNAPIVTGTPLIGATSYFTSSDPSAAQLSLPTYSTVTYQNVYAGINLVFQADSNGKFAYDFQAQPGADLSQIKVGWDGVSSSSIDAGTGNLVLNTPGGPVLQNAPAAYQVQGVTKTSVGVQQVINADGTLSFQVSGYDPTQEVVIDPTVSYSTYIGGSGNDYVYGTVTDAAGDVFVTGSTASTNFPATTGAYNNTNGATTNVFVAKYSPSGQVDWRALLGGNSGASSQGNAIAVDSAGNVYIAGLAGAGFPTSNAIAGQSFPGTGSTGFVAGFDSGGNALTYSTPLGPTGALLNAIAVDANGAAYVTGSSTTGYPVTTGAFQTTCGGSINAVLSKVAPGGGTLSYSTFIGGTMLDDGYGIRVDAAGNAFLTGLTFAGMGTAFVTTSGAYQRTYPGTLSIPANFVVELNAAGSAEVFSTFVGPVQTPASNLLMGISLDTSDNVYVAGQTGGSYPTTSGAFGTSSGSGGFVTKLAAGGGSLGYSGVLSSGTMTALALDGQGDAFVTGQTTGSLPVTSGAFQSTYGGSNDAFVVEINPSGSTITYASYLGGSSNDQGTAIATDLYGNAYVAGYTSSTNFPTSNAAQATNGGGTDGFVAKLAVVVPPTITTITPDTGKYSNDQITNATTITLSGTAAASSTVTLFRDGVGQLGTTLANSSGLWTYSYTGTVLPEGVTGFYGTDTVGGVTSNPSADFLATVDLTPPKVAVSVPAATYSLGPQVQVSASDLNGLPTGTTVALDVSNGTTTTLGYATGTLTNGTALIKLPTLASTGTYTVDARVTDLAGNVGTSTLATFVVSNNPTPWAATAVPPVLDPYGNALLQVGDVSVQQPLDFDLSPGTSQGGDPALVYHSDWTTVKPFIQVNIPTDTASALPPSITATLIFNGVTQTAVTYTVGAGVSSGDGVTLALQDSTALTGAGAYPWTVQLKMNYGTAISRTVTGTAYMVSEDSSAFGAGWTLSTVDQLVSVTGGVLRIYGSGGWTFYSSLGGGSFQSQPWDNGTLSQSGGTYTYQTPDGQTWTFNSSGYQTQWASADGQQRLQYRYNGSNLVTGITAIDGALTTITYSGTPALAQTISEPNSKTVSLAYSGTNLTQITNPDSGKNTFSYDGNHHVTSETFGILQNQWAYSNGALGTATWGSSTGPGGASNPSVTTYSPGLTVGLSALVAGAIGASVTDPNGNTTKEQLDSSGRVVQQIAPDGGVTQYGWSQVGGVDAYLTSITDPLGRTTTMARDSAGYVTQETLPDGHTESWGYQSPYHALTQFTNPNGNSTTYAYDNSTGHPTSTTDALGDVTTIVWTGNGLVQSVSDANNHTSSYLYDTSRRLTTNIDPAGNRVTATYDSNGNPQTITDRNNHTSTIQYDSMARLTGAIDALGNRTTATFDVSGLPLTYLDQLGHKTSLVYDGFHRGLTAQVFQALGTPAQTAALASYDPAGNATSLTDGLGNTLTQGFDGLNRVSQVTNALGGVTLSQYDLAGQMTGSRDELGRWTQSAYNSRGWVTTSTDALGNVTTMAYDPGGDLTTFTDALNHTTSLSYDKLDRKTLLTDPLGHTTSVALDKVGNVTAGTDRNGNQSTYAYDVLDRRTSLTAAAGTSIAETMTTAYDPVGNITSRTDGNGNQTTFAYDVVDRRTAMTVAAGTGSAQTWATAYDSASNVTATTDALGKTTSYVLDGLNRPTAVTDPLSHTTTAIFDAVSNTVGSIDALGNLTQSAYDPLQRPIATVDALGGVVQSVYDSVGNVRGVIDSVGNVTTYVDDALNRQVQSTDPQGHAATVAYNAVSDITGTTDRLGRSITYAYDSAHRLTAATWLATGGTIVLNTRKWNFDNNGNVTSATDNAGTYTLNYDALDRLTGQTDVFGLSLTYNYDKANNQTLVQDSLGGVVTSVYDNANRVTERSLNGGTGMELRVYAGYNADNELTSLTRYSNLVGTVVAGTTSQAFDTAGRLTAITNFNGSGATVSYYNDSYDAANRVTQEVWGSGSTTGTHVYGYDSINQVTSADGTTYTFDHNGNRTMSGYTTGTNNQVTNDGTWTYTYDAEGNLIQKVSATATFTYGWDNLNRLVSIKEVTTTGTQLQVTYVYDIFNNRVEEDKWTASTGTTVVLRHAYDDQGNIWADVTSTNTLLARYVYGDGTNQLWARAIPSGLTNAGVAYYLTDRLGSVRDITDSTGVIQDHTEYDGYGNPTNTTLSYADERGYAGGEYDYDTKLEHFGARYYDPATGRWTSQDPMSYAAGDGNLYRYVGNDATNAMDPSGYEPIILPGPGTGTGTGVGPSWGPRQLPPLPSGDPIGEAHLRRTEWEKWEERIQAGSDKVRVDRAAALAISMGVDPAAIKSVRDEPRIGDDHWAITKQRLDDIYKLVLQRRNLERLAASLGNSESLRAYPNNRDLL